AVDQLEAKLADQTKSLDTLQKDYNSLRNDVANLHLAQADLLSEVQEQLAQASGNLAGDDEDLAELFATQDNLVRKLQRLESEQQDAFAFTRDAIEELREDVVNHDSRLAALQTGAQNSTAKTIEEATKRLATLEARFAERDQTLRALSNDQQYLVAALEEQSENLAQVYENIDEIAEAVQTRKSPEPNTSNATVDLEGKLKKQLNNLEEAWKAALAQIQDLSSTTQTLEGSLKQVRSEVDSLDVAQRGLGDWLEDQQGQLASLDGTLEKVARDEPQTRSPSNWQSALEDLQRGWEAKFDAQQQVIAALSEQLKRQNKAPKSIKSEVSATELQELRQLCLENRDNLNEFLTHRKTLTAELGATRKGLSDIEAKCTHLSDMESRLNTREQMLTDLSRSHATVESILRATQTKVALLQKEVERARASKDDQKQGETLVKSITKAQDSLIVDVATAKRKMEGLERKLELVKELEDKLREKDALLSNLDFNQRNLEKRLDTTQGKVSYLEKQLTTLERIDRQIGTLQRRVAAAE
ncbi:MAG: hypothetical protein KDK78_04325, partial [Chlamydiia bacterium]|nr:hypothetical protein [Chlamydiia bacterium]